MALTRGTFWDDIGNESQNANFSLDKNGTFWDMQASRPIGREACMVLEGTMGRYFGTFCFVGLSTLKRRKQNKTATKTNQFEMVMVKL